MIVNSSRRVLLISAGCALLATGCGKKPESDSATPSTANAADSGIVLPDAQRAQIQTAKVEKSSFNPSITTTGTVTFNGDQSTQVLAAISGPVVKLMVNTGDSVAAGQVLATVSSPDFAAAVSGYRKSESAFHNAQRIESLDEKLFAADALARADLDQAKADLASADADRDAAMQQLRSLGVDDASITAIRDGKSVPGTQSAIRAPIAGIVVEKLINPGQLLQAGTTTTFTIADLSSVWVMGNAFESMIGAVHKGETVMITTDASPDSFPGRVDYVGALVDPDSKATPVRILVPNRQGVLKQNMLVRVAIRGSRPRTGILVPVASVLRDDDNLPYVFVASGKDRFLRRRITLGERMGDQYEVTAGIAAGDVVVTQGALYLGEAGSQ